jgi:hypothetical protein
MVAVMTLSSSAPPTNVWAPREGSLDYFIGNWLPYFDKCQGTKWQFWDRIKWQLVQTEWGEDHLSTTSSLKKGQKCNLHW